MTSPAARIPDWSPGDVIAAYEDGTIVLDDGITTWNPARAQAFVTAGGRYQEDIQDALDRGLTP